MLDILGALLVGAICAAGVAALGGLAPHVAALPVHQFDGAVVSDTQPDG